MKLRDDYEPPQHIKMQMVQDAQTSKPSQETKLDKSEAMLDASSAAKQITIKAMIANEGELMNIRKKKTRKERKERKRVEFDQMQLTATQTQTSSSTTTSFETTPKRSKSEAPSNNAISDVLYQVHLKLINRSRKLSPDKVLAKQMERQQKAEHLRAKIESSRQEWAKKVKQRQQLARARFNEERERKRVSLQDKLEQAARKKEAELQNVVEKAKAENLKAEETNFFNRLTKENQQLDLDNKLNEYEERRKQQQQRDLEKIREQGQRREAADKRRQELNEELKSKILTKEQKRE